MATVTGLTSQRMRDIEAACIVEGAVLLDDLILTRHDGTSFNAGSVRGLPGAPGINATMNATELAGNIDLNTLTTPGYYTQSTNAEAASGTNYPEAYAGLLQVNIAPDNNMIWQTYTFYNVYPDRVYRRSRYNNVWSAWNKFIAESDTGWLTSGLTITTATNWTLNSYSLRKTGNHVVGAVTATYSGSTLTVGADGNLGDQNGVVIMPSGWRNGSSIHAMIPVWRNGYSILIGRASSGGTGLDIVAGVFPNQVVTTDVGWSFMVDYYTD